ncbi:MAG: MerR family DNA-binding protein [SAR324 cluster bacterium]|nr:MerR family DNA-binding protein [SAR324 cluster bacterium]
MNGMTIGKVSSRTGVGIETIRFYERRGLIAEPARRPSGYRDYPPAVIERVRFIKKAKELGFSLREIAELLSLRVDNDRTCADVYSRATAKIGEIEEKMRELERMKGALETLASACTGAGPTGECPFLDALEGENGLSTGATIPS